MTMKQQNEIRRHDQNKNFVEGQYVSASEAAWRILGFGYVDRQPLVVQLDIHLRVHHTVYYNEGNEQAAAGWDRPERR